MGKRKSRAKPAPKKRMDKLDTVFDCPFCCNSKSVECRIDMKNLIAEAHCNDCKESYSTTATTLTEAIDVYSEWIDECERVNNLEDEDDLRSYKRGRQELDNDDLEGEEEEEDDDDVRPYKMPRREQEEDEDDLEDEDDVRQYKQPRRREFLQEDDDDLPRREQVDELEDEVEEEYEYEDDDVGIPKRPSGRQVNDPEDEYEEEEEDDL
ncbi:hypothetical protein DM860_000826 [Cuscuta australis]|uniref:Transcription elongation factor 1 homolog n=1 Tax=Cuscuta australis TaxID=267555 RepID=A0A328CXC4_9ASTE|nr:hypothetical protein DM860_000826 [Cuscuta australis]